MKSKNNLLNNIVSNYKNRNAIYIIYSGLVEYPLFIVFPPPVQIGLAAGVAPIFFFIVGLVLAFTLWLLQKITGKRLSLLFYIFIYGLVGWQLFIALDFYLYSA